VVLVTDALARLEAGASPDAVAAELGAAAGVTVAADDLDGWFGSLDAEAVATIQLTPPAHELRRLQLSRNELVEVARRFMATSESDDQANDEWWMALFDANVPHPAGSTLAFYPPSRDAGTWNPSPEEVVELALAYRPIAL
jgi:hypothetical protein